MTMIQINQLHKTYGNITAVQELNLDIRGGELLALLGVNGAGKTTLIKLLSCVTEPTSGDALLGGNSITRDAAKVKRIIGVSPQETAVAPNLTVKENLELICGIHGFSREETQARVRELCGQFALNEVLSRKAGKLSGGWQRRLSIAMAMIGEPKILFLDEPTLGLDVLARHSLWELIRSVKGQVTVILTTHYLEEAQALADRIAIMGKGKLLAVGTAAELMEKTHSQDFETAFVSIAQKGVENL